MLSRRPLAATVVATLLTGLLLAACGSGPSAQTLGRDAARAFATAPVKTIQGSFVDGAIPVSVKVTVAPDGDASGTGTFDHFPVAFLRVGGKTYIQGVAYWQWERLLWWKVWPQLGEQWVRTFADPATSAFESASTGAGAVTLLRRQPARLSAGSPVPRGNRRLYPLTYGSTTYEVTGGPDHRLVSIRDPASRAGRNLLSRTRLSIVYGGRLEVSAPAPGQFVDDTDLSTLPALYTDMGNAAKATCDRTGCTLTEKIGNDGGPPVGQSVLTVTFYEEADEEGPLASCQAAIPAIPHDGSAQVSCEAHGAALVAWTSINEYWWGVTITNPPYSSS